MDRCRPRIPPPASPCEGEAADVHFLLEEAAAGGPRWSLRTDGVRVAHTEDLRLALDLLESHLRTAVALRSPHRLFVHAGAVARGGRAILIPGRSHAGKTSLVAALVRRGARYLSDENAVLDARGRVHPLPKPLSVRRPGNALQVDVPVERFGGRIATGPMPAALVAVTEYRPGAAWEPIRLSPGQAVLALLEHTVPARTRPGFALEVLERVALRTTCLRGPRGEADETAMHLLRELEESKSGSAPSAPVAAGTRRAEARRAEARWTETSWTETRGRTP